MLPPPRSVSLYFFFECHFGFMKFDVTEYFQIMGIIEFSLKKKTCFQNLGKEMVLYLIWLTVWIFLLFYRKLGTFLNFKNLETCLKDAILLDYYVSGFLWARGMDFSIIQYSKFMTLLAMLLQNLKSKYIIFLFLSKTNSVYHLNWGS